MKQKTILKFLHINKILQDTYNVQTIKKTQQDHSLPFSVPQTAFGFPVEPEVNIT